MLFVLCGCGGSDSPSAPESTPGDRFLAESGPDPSLRIAVTGCDSRSYDSGHVLYVIRRRDCTATGPQPTQIVERAAGLAAKTYLLMLDSGGAAQSVVFTALGTRTVRAFQEGQWHETPNASSWAPRDGAGLLIKDGRAYLLGGWVYGPASNEVWVSDDLENWQFLGFAPWEARHGAGWVVHHDRLFVVGGDLYTDVWSSADGVTWRQEAASTPFIKRYTPNVASMGGSLYLYGGLRWLPNDWCERFQTDCTVEGLNDVWRSDDDGRTWQQLVEHAPWAGRGLIHGNVVHDGQLWIMSGGLKVLPSGGDATETSAEYGDAWSSSDGISWTRRVEALPFPTRTHVSVAETSVGCVISDGSVGTQANVSNDLFIAPDCVNYVAVPNPPLPKRHASSLVEFNGTLVILGGPPTGNPGTAIWQYVP